MAFLKHIWNRWQNLLHDEKLKHKIYVIIFESDTPMGKLFDVALIGFIVLSILVVVAESIKSWDAVIGPYLRVSEYVFTFFFTLEYVLRLYCSPKPRKYAFSFFGIVDLLLYVLKGSLCEGDSPQCGEMSRSDRGARRVSGWHGGSRDGGIVILRG